MNKIYHYCLIGCFSIIGLSCSQEVNLSKQNPPVEQMSNKEQLDYAKKNLLTLGSATVALANKDNDFRSTVYEEIEKAFDGEFNVLIKTLGNLKSKNGKSENKIHTTLVSILGTESLAKSALESFDNVANTNYYPQIYIPFFEELKQSGKIGAEEPILVVLTEHLQTFPGYKVDSNGKLVETGFLVDESYAKQHEVWVMSINERVDRNGNPIPDLVADNSSGRTKGTYYPNAKFEWIQCWLHKETWAAGASEVHIKRYKSFYSLSQYGSPHAGTLTAEDNVDDGDGWRIYQFTRSDVSNAKKIHRQWLYVSDWPNLTTEIEDNQFPHTDYLYYVIFEYDAWPTALNTVSIPDASSSGYFIDTCYRSSEIYYQIGYIPEGQANGWELSEGDGFWAESWF